VNANSAIAWARRNAIALLALFVALGGTGYAAATINGKLIKNGTIGGKKLKNQTISGKKLKKDTLGARQVKESTLGKVPSATLADSASAAEKAKSADTATSANSADNAARLDGAPASSYTTRLFARVAYTDSTPEVLAQSGGIAGAGEQAAGMGFPQLTFPRDMTNCAIIATPFAAGGQSVMRQSHFSSGNLVVFAITNLGTASPGRTDFNVVGVC
jgi:hypothetical protein